MRCTISESAGGEADKEEALLVGCPQMRLAATAQQLSPHAEALVDLILLRRAAQVTESAGAEADEEVSLVAGRLQVDVAATNQQPVPLALVKARLLHPGSGV